MEEVILWVIIAVVGGSMILVALESCGDIGKILAGILLHIILLPLKLVLWIVTLPLSAILLLFVAKGASDDEKQQSVPETNSRLPKEKDNVDGVTDVIASQLDRDLQLFNHIQADCAKRGETVTHAQLADELHAIRMAKPKQTAPSANPAKKARSPLPEGPSTHTVSKPKAELPCKTRATSESQGKLQADPRMVDAINGLITWYCIEDQKKQRDIFLKMVDLCIDIFKESRNELLHFFVKVPSDNIGTIFTLLFIQNNTTPFLKNEKWCYVTGPYIQGKIEEMRAVAINSIAKRGNDFSSLEIAELYLGALVKIDEMQDESFWRDSLGVCVKDTTPMPYAEKKSPELSHSCVTPEHKEGNTLGDSEPFDDFQRKRIADGINGLITWSRIRNHRERCWHFQWALDAVVPFDIQQVRLSLARRISALSFGLWLAKEFSRAPRLPLLPKETWHDVDAEMFKTPPCEDHIDFVLKEIEYRNPELHVRTLYNVALVRVRNIITRRVYLDDDDEDILFCVKGAETTGVPIDKLEITLFSEEEIESWHDLANQSSVIDQPQLAPSIPVKETHTAPSATPEPREDKRTKTTTEDIENGINGLITWAQLDDEEEREALFKQVVDAAIEASGLPTYAERLQAALMEPLAFGMIFARAFQDSDIKPFVKGEKWHDIDAYLFRTPPTEDEIEKTELEMYERNPVFNVLRLYTMAMEGIWELKEKTRST